MLSAAERDPNGPVLGASRVGAELQAARQRLGWALPDVSATLRIRLPFLQAIEEGRIADLPGNTYAVGFLRTYATALGLDPAEVARRFRAEAHEVNRRSELTFPAPVPDRGVPAGAVVLLGVLLAVGAYAGWYSRSGQVRAPAEVTAVPERLARLVERPVPPSEPAPQDAAVPLLSAPAAPALAALHAAAATLPAAMPTPAIPVVANERRITLRVTSDAWIQVRERQGPVLLSRVMRTGETWPVPKGAPLTLTTGNAGGTELLVDGEAVPPLGPSGAVRRDVALEPDLLKTGR